MKKKSLIFGLIFLACFLIGSVSAVQYTGCSDPSLNTGGRSCVEITSASCTQLPARCATLSASNTYYLMMEDINTPRQGFEVSGTNSIFDLNEYTLTFGDSAPPNLVNDGFEDSSICTPGNCNSVSGWDFSNALNAEITDTFPEAHAYWIPGELGTQVLKFNSGISTDQYVLSDPIAIDPGRRYSLSYIIHASSSVDAENTAVIVEPIGGTNSWYIPTSACGTLGGIPGSSGFYAPDHTGVWGAAALNIYTQSGGKFACSFTSTASSVRIRIEYNGATQPLSNDLYIDKILFKPSDRWESGGEEGGFNLPTSANNVEITNGNVVQGQAGTLFSHGFYGRGNYMQIDNVNLDVYGSDMMGIYIRGDATNGIGNEIHDNTILHEVNRTHYSHEGIWYGNVIRTQSLTDGKIYNNVIPRASAGISSTVIYGNPTDNVEIYNNTINVVSNAIHSYAFGVSGQIGYGAFNTHIKIHDNFVNNSRGSGIFIEGGARDGEVYNNYFEIRDGPQEEREWTAKGLWMRYSSANFTFDNNTFIVYGGEDVPRLGEDTSVVGVRIGSQVNTEGPIKFDNNYVEVKMTSAKPFFPQCYQSSGLLHGTALHLGTDTADGIVKYIENNTFKSNDYIIGFGGFYAGSFHSYLVSNTFIKADNALPEFATVYHAYSSYGNGDNLLLNNTGVNGADVHDIINCQTSGTSIDTNVSWYLDVEVLQGVTPATGALIQIYDTNGVLRGSRTVSGGSEIFALTEEYLSGTGLNPVTTPYSPYAVNVTYLGETQSQIVDLDSSQTISFYFGGTSPDVNSDGSINIKDLALEVYWSGKDVVAEPNYFHLDLDDSGGVDWLDVIQIILRI